MRYENPRRRSALRWAAFCMLLALLGFGVYQTLTHPKTPLSDAWNPLASFSVSDAESPLTEWKLRRVLNNPALCVAVLMDAAQITTLDPFESSENCHIRNRVELTGVGDTHIDPIETSCATALRLTLWNHHGLQPAARDILGAEVAVVRQIGSYNCRPIRTINGNSTRWSTHSTADAIDITGFDLSDGRRIRLIDDWGTGTPEAQFLRTVRDSACTWFATALGPDYNSLHADHFHLQSRGWGTCR